MTKTSEKYERTQQGNLLAGPVHTEIVSSRLLVWQVSNCQRILPANYSIFRFNFDPFYACNGHIMKIVANKKKWHVETGMFETFHSEQMMMTMMKMVVMMMMTYLESDGDDDDDHEENDVDDDDDLP